MSTGAGHIGGGVDRARPLWVGGLVAVVVTALAAWWFAGGSPANQSSGSLAGSTNDLIVRVDTRGAIVTAKEGLRGYSRSAGYTWTDTESGNIAADVICGKTCPSAVSSSSLLSIGSPRAPDQLPRTLGGATLPPVVQHPSPGVVKDHVLAVSSRSVVRVTSDTSGVSTLEVVAANGAGTSFDIPSYDVTWIETKDATRAVAQIYISGQGLRAQRFIQRRGVWAPVGGLVGRGSHMACIAEDGTLLMDKPLRFIHPDGSRTRLQNLPSGGNCRFYGDGVVVAAYTQTSSASGTSVSTVVNSVSLHGETLWRKTFRNTEARVTAYERGNVFAVAAGQSVLVLTREGRVLKTISGAQDASFDGRGELVLLRDDGTVSWQHRQQ